MHALPTKKDIGLDIVTNTNSSSFIRRFKQLISRYGYSDHVLSDNRQNFASEESKNFVASRYTEWHLN